MTTIAPADIIVRLSTSTGPGQSTAGAPATSLGGFVSTTLAGSDLFDNVTGVENLAGTVDYRCVFVKNTHPTLTAIACRAYLSSEVAGGASIALAVDNAAASSATAVGAQAATIASETTAPAAVGAFWSPTTDVGGVLLGDLAPGQVRALWLRRTPNGTGPLTGDGAGVTVGFSTP